MIGWIKNVISAVLPNAIGQGAATFEKKAKAKLTDINGVAEGAPLVEEARRRSLEFMNLLRKSGGRMEKFRLRLSARRKVKKGIADVYDIPEIVDEVTEKIMETAQEDPYFRRLFR